ncbi:MAG: Mrp/NBP35 family ATP-binding protein [Leptospiraceae bacterium]|nr:Mrp/NBP35 family ATP-binding protein [Leptospiraceae bacterium]MCK6381947.1 Mrp/NBP35 family ATP-binding protein [Leptospiraceae bacterium]NUM41820.1 Mrp/NBP35 family ATP-binding protein [Leptospiraceae bacterium]
MSSITKEKIQAELAKIRHPVVKRDLVSLGMVDTIEEIEEIFHIQLKTPDDDRKLQFNLEANIRQTLTRIDNSKKYKIKFVKDPNLQFEEGNSIPGVKKVIAIGSGKGGVGKSTVTTNIAVTLMKQGLKVGILDSDIYGPSIGKLFGVQGKVALKAEEDRIYPLEKFGLKIISFAFLVNEDQPVVWRGPMLGKAVEQFLYDVVWGELDYLLIDLPPGTGDVQLSLAQLIDIDGAVIVTTPQNLALLDASKAGTMFSQVKIPILGVVENMSEFICPHCNKPSKIFSSGGGEKLSNSFHSPLLGKIPLLLEIMESGESGDPVSSTEKSELIKNAYSDIVKNLLAELKKLE